MQAITSIRNCVEQIPANSWTATFIMLVPIIDVLFILIKEKQFKGETALNEISQRRREDLEKTEASHPTWKELKASDEDFVDPNYLQYLKDKSTFLEKNSKDAGNIYPPIGHLDTLTTRSRQNIYFHFSVLTIISIFKKVMPLFAILYIGCAGLSAVVVNIKAHSLDELSLNTSSHINWIQAKNNPIQYKQELERRQRHPDIDLEMAQIARERRLQALT
jgi:hypothetical protein